MILFKYLGPDRVDVLEQGLIRFTQPKNFNDPFESLPFVDSLLRKKEIDKYLKWAFKQIAADPKLFTNELKRVIDECTSKYDIPENVIAEIRKIKSNDMLKCGCELAKPLFSEYLGLETIDYKAGAQIGVQNSFHSRFGVLCLCANICSILMWSHYANGHKGFAVGFDSNHHWFGPRKKELLGKLRRVKYSFSRPMFDGFSFDADSQQQVNRILDDFIFTKSKKWAYEREWRIVKDVETADKKIDNGEDVRLFKFPPEIINCVVLGCRMTEENRGKIKKVLQDESKYCNVELFEAGVDLNTFNLNFAEVKV